MSPAKPIYVDTGPVTTENFFQLLKEWMKPAHWANGNIPIPPAVAFDRLFEIEFWHANKVHRTTYTIPSRELIATVRDYLQESGQTRLLGIGSGSGYIEKLFKLSGIDTVATDKNTSDDFVEKLNARAAIRKYPDRAIFMSWPYPEITTQVINTIKTDGLKPMVFLAQNGDEPREICAAFSSLRELCGEPLVEVKLPNVFPRVKFNRPITNRLAVFGPPRDPI